MKSGNLNFLEPSGPLQACNGTNLPLPFFLKILIVYQLFFDLPKILFPWHSAAKMM